MIKEPTFDSGEYPTEDTIKTISEWLIAGYSDCYELLDFVRKAWCYPEYFSIQCGVDVFEKACNKYHISTGGWSGNESLIQGMKENVIFWSMCWEQSRRGGHYIFELPIRAESK